MAHKRVVRVLSYEGNEEWVDKMTEFGNRLFSKSGTMKELYRVEGDEIKEFMELLTLVSQH